MPKNEAKSGGTVKVRLVKGLRGTKGIHRLSVKALGLGKLNSVRELKDSPQVRGLESMQSPGRIAAKRGKKVEELHHA